MQVAAPLIGRRFHQATIIGIAKSNRGRRFLFQCDCGNTFVTTLAALTIGTTRSCGCWRKRRMAMLATIRTKHGHAVDGETTPEYRCWGDMIARCSNPNNKRFDRYGKRGISVCDRWRDFRNFFADMGKRPRGLTLERINNEGDYEPGNCRWATRAEQTANRAITKWIYYDGHRVPLHVACKATGVPDNTVKRRAKQRGISSQRAFDIVICERIAALAAANEARRKRGG